MANHVNHLNCKGLRITLFKNFAYIYLLKSLTYSFVTGEHCLNRSKYVVCRKSSCLQPIRIICKVANPVKHYSNLQRLAPWQLAQLNKTFLGLAFTKAMNSILGNPNGGVRGFSVRKNTRWKDDSFIFQTFPTTLFIIIDGGMYTSLTDAAGRNLGILTPEWGYLDRRCSSCTYIW